MYKIVYFIMSSVFAINLQAQSQFGVKLNTEEAYDGYILFENTQNTYLINNCGEILNTWDGVNQTDNHTKFTVDGTMMYIRNNAVLEVDWDGTILNFVTHGDQNLLLEYESILLPNKNYLCLGRRAFTLAQFEAVGYDPGIGFPSQVDVVVELDRNTGQIVWEWNIIDHMIQDSNPSANNYGDISENPQLLNAGAINTVDWIFTESFMINGMDYNPELDQIALSVRKLGEVVVIDHSTTTEEAKGSTGGKYGKGGDILYRWGNPMNYGRGTVEDRVLYFQHNPNWITEGSHKGKLIIFNNGLARPNTSVNYSSIPIISTPVDEDGFYTIMNNAAFGPEEPDVNYDRNDTDSQFFSAYTSGAEVMPNENIYVTLGQEGRLFELNTAGDVVWEYIVKWDDYIFRSEKYSKDHPIFEGKDLTPIGTVEQPSTNYVCDLYTAVEDDLILDHVSVAQNFYQPEIVNISNLLQTDLNMKLFNMQGQLLKEINLDRQDGVVELYGMENGYYVLQIIDKESKGSKSFKLALVR